MGTERSELVYAIAKRARELGDKTLKDLRLEAGYGCSTPGEALQRNRYKGRGELIEEILLEEFIEEF